MGRESGCLLPTLAGPEIGVASTKAFTTQLSVLACLAVAIAEAKKVVLQDRLEKLAQALIELPKSVDDALSIDPAARHVAAMLVGARDVLYLSRGSMFPIAMEGALDRKSVVEGKSVSGRVDLGGRRLI